MSKTVGLIAKLLHIVPTRTLLDTYWSLITPCIMYGLISGGNASKTLPNQILILSKKCPPSSTLLPKGKITTPKIPILWKSCKFNVWCKLEFCIILNLFFKSPAFSLVVHVRQNLSNFTQNNLHSIFKERPLHVLVLKSGMRYKLILKFYPKTLLKNLLKKHYSKF